MLSPRKKGGPNPFSELRAYGNLGLDLFSAVLIGSIGGYLLDRWLVTKPLFLLVGLLLGAAAGFKNLYKAITRDSQKEKEE